MRLESPWALLLLVFLPIFLETELFQKFFGRIFRRPPKTTDQISLSLPISSAELPLSRKATLRTSLLSTLKATAFILLVLALARPQTGTHFVETEASGRDIMLTLDLSGSMNALDFSIDGQRVNRLMALQDVVGKFIKERSGDRIGLVVFGENAFTQCPLTLDHNTLLTYLNDLRIGMAGQATAIGEAIAVSLKRLKDIESDSKVIILVTDGKSNAGSITPKDAAELSKKMNVKIHTIGIGGAGMAPFPTQTFFGTQTIGSRNLEFDEAALKEISALTGGKYYFADDTTQLKNIYKEIDTLEERKEKTHEFVEYEEQFLKFTKTGLMILVGYLLLQSTVFLKIP
jgi:Ca-activated chloride channel family protein